LPIGTLTTTPDLLTLIEQDLGPGKRIGAWVFWHCPFHPDGTPSFSVKNDRYYCFGCHATGDAVDWLVEYRRLPKRQALELVKGSNGRPYHPPKPKPKPQPESEGAEAWAESALREVVQANERLFRPEGQAVREYLTRRGFGAETVQVWALGAAEVFNPSTNRQEPAVVIPSFDRGEITAVKYRFLNGELRYRMRKGSRPSLFGLWQSVKPYLAIVEGELNAVSLWQVAAERFLVISPGSQSAGRAMLLDLLKNGRFAQKVLWFDDPHLAREYAPFADLVITSPTVNNHKLDANALLQTGELTAFWQRAITRIDNTAFRTAGSRAR